MSSVSDVQRVALNSFTVLPKLMVLSVMTNYANTLMRVSVSLRLRRSLPLLTSMATFSFRAASGILSGDPSDLECKICGELFGTPATCTVSVRF